MRHELVERFKKDHGDCLCTAFLIMRFSSKSVYKIIHEALSDSFERLGVKLLRADDKAYSDDLFENVRLYADCCSFGVAVFDRIESDYFNPNVSLEVGIMLGRQKPVMLFKDDTLTTLHTDLVGRLYVPMDIHEPAEGLDQRILKWMDDNSINPCSKRLSVVIKLEEAGWDYENSKELVSGIPMFIQDAGPVYYRGIRKSDENFIIDYDASQRFCDKLRQKHQNGDFKYLSKVDIVDIETSDEQSQLVDYIYVDRKSEKYEVQYCFLETFEECQELAERAKKHIGNLTSNLDECVIFIARHDGFMYVHSNFLLPGYIYPTKMLASKLDGIEYLLPLILDSKHNSVRDSKDLLFAHAANVVYVFDYTYGNDLPFEDMLGATNILKVEIS